MPKQQVGDARTVEAIDAAERVALRPLAGETELPVGPPAARAAASDVDNVGAHPDGFGSAGQRDRGDKVPLIIRTPAIRVADDVVELIHLHAGRCFMRAGRRMRHVVHAECLHIYVVIELAVGEVGRESAERQAGVEKRSGRKDTRVARDRTELRALGVNIADGSQAGKAVLIAILLAVLECEHSVHTTLVVDHAIPPRHRLVIKVLARVVGGNEVLQHARQHRRRIKRENLAADRAYAALRNYVPGKRIALVRTEAGGSGCRGIDALDAFAGGQRVVDLHLIRVEVLPVA